MPFLMDRPCPATTYQNALAVLEHWRPEAVVWWIADGEPAHRLPGISYDLPRVLACDCAGRVVGALGEQAILAQRTLWLARRSTHREPQHVALEAMREMLRPGDTPLVREALAAVLVASAAHMDGRLATTAAEHAAFAAAMLDPAYPAVCWMLEREWQEQRLCTLLGCGVLEPA